MPSPLGFQEPAFTGIKLVAVVLDLLSLDVKEIGDSYSRDI